LVDTETFASVIETRNIQLNPGDLVVSYTDGITEAMNSAQEEWGIERLTENVERMVHASADDLLANIQKNVLAFTGNAPQSDDMTMLALKVR